MINRNEPKERERKSKVFLLSLCGGAKQKKVVIFD
jgi:hypothetical protein